MATEGGLLSFAGSVGWYRVRELRSRKETDATLPLHSQETNAWRWEQIAQPRGSNCPALLQCGHQDEADWEGEEQGGHLGSRILKEASRNFQRYGDAEFEDTPDWADGVKLADRGGGLSETQSPHL